MSNGKHILYETFYDKVEDFDLLHDNPLFSDRELLVRQCLSISDSYAEKVSVAFAEWKEKKTCVVNDKFIFSTGEGLVDFDTLSDLYQYFINNVYNQ